MSELEALHIQVIDLIEDAYAIDTDYAKRTLADDLEECQSDEAKITVLRSWVQVFSNAS